MSGSSPTSDPSQGAGEPSNKVPGPQPPDKLRREREAWGRLWGRMNSDIAKRLREERERDERKPD